MVVKDVGSELWLWSFKSQVHDLWLCVLGQLANLSNFLKNGNNNSI